MAWVKIPKENHPLFYARLPKDRRIQTLQMFGAAAAKANGHMFGGLFAHSFMVKLGPADYAAALALDGAVPFDPMGNGRVMSNTVLMPEWVMDDPAEMASWLKRAFDHVLTLSTKKQPPKRLAKPVRNRPSAKPAKKRGTEKGTTKRRS
jgi:TfoX/Sxy family transcriptional regulator of competence genes